MNEFQTVLNGLPMATVCSEARSHATAFCQAQLGPVNLFYAVDANNKPSDYRDEISEPIFAQQTTVIITNAYNKEDGPKGFDFCGASSRCSQSCLWQSRGADYSEFLVQKYEQSRRDLLAA